MDTTIYSSSIEYDYNKFVSNTVSKNSSLDAKQYHTTQIITAITHHLNPFSCVSSNYNFTILDQKIRTKQNGSFNFISEQLPLKASNPMIKHFREYGFSISHTFISKVNEWKCIEWSNCQNALDEILNSKDEHLKDVQKFINQKNELSIFLLGKEMSQTDNYLEQLKTANFFFALEYQNNRQKIIDLVANHQLKQGIVINTPHLLSKYLIFPNLSKYENKFYFLELSINFVDKKANYEEYLKKGDLKHSNQIYDCNKFSCKFQIVDKNQLFLDAINGMDQKQQIKNLLKKFKFNTHGDYVEYPFKEPLLQRKKLISERSYSLAFQGGGAKGVAYVGAYKAIRESLYQGQPIPITGIMGSSAGGIIALAVSTGIEPMQVQKICYSMNAIPSTDRIDRNYFKEIGQTDDQIKINRNAVLTKIQKILCQYGLVQPQLIDKLVQMYQKIDQNLRNQFQMKLIDFLLAANQSIGQILDFNVQNYRQLNVLGLILQGALMKGEAIHDIGSQCLVRYILMHSQTFKDQITLRKYFKEEMVGHLIRLVTKFDINCLNVCDINYRKLSFKSNDQKINKKHQRAIITIINKVMVILQANTKSTAGKDLQINQIFISKLAKWFDFKSIYDQNQNFNLEILLNNHYKVHLKSDPSLSHDQLLKKQKRSAAISQIIFQNNGKISYETLSQTLGEEYFLNPNNFIPKQKQRQINEEQNQLNKNNELNHISLIHFLFDIFIQSANLLQNQLIVRTISEAIVQTLKNEDIVGLFTQREKNEVQDYINDYNQLKKIAQKITMKEYYKLTQVQLTCTSVDLDNKILRFFNHKTTPQLTVCRAVQMTGSFPVGFKAQAWKTAEWGKYYVHYQDYRRQIDLNRHQFTDGGMLANFPIKYFDNGFIRDNYFSHIINKNKQCQTVLLGFGLDKLADGSYSLSQQQIAAAKIANLKVKKAKEELLILLDKIGGGKLSLLLKFRQLKSTFGKQPSSVVEWSSLNSQLLNEIPLIKFIVRLLSSYPLADRNLNLQCFANSIIVTQMQPVEPTLKQVDEKNIKSLINFIKAKKYPGIQKQLVQRSKFNPLKYFETKQEDPNVDTSKLEQIISGQIDQTPYNKVFLRELSTMFIAIRNRFGKKEQMENQNRKYLKDLKYKLKYKIMKVIFNKMQLNLSESKIKQQTLKFLCLKYKNKILIKQSQKICINKFDFQCDQYDYEQIEEHIPLQQFNKKMIRAELSSNIKEAKNIEIKKGQEYLIKLGEECQAEYINIQKYIISKQWKYFVQYIFLSKINTDDEATHERAIDILRKVSYKDLLLFENEKEEAYITLRDLKRFYHKMFTNPNILLQDVNLNHNFLTQDRYDVYSKDQNINNQKNDDYLQSFGNNKSITTEIQYIQRKITPKVLQNEGYQLLKNYICRVEFKSIVLQSYSTSKNAKIIEDQLIEISKIRAIQCSQQLGAVLNLDFKLSKQYFVKLMEEPVIKQKIINVLFNKNRIDYSQNRFVSQILQTKFQQHCEYKREMLKNIQNQISKELNCDPKTVQNNLYKINNPMNVQLFYYTQLQQRISFKLLQKKLLDENLLHFNIQNASLSTNLRASQQTKQNAKYRTNIQNQLTAQKQQRKLLNKQLADKLKIYHGDFQKLCLMLTEIQYGLDRFCQSKNSSLYLIKLLLSNAQYLGTAVTNIKQHLIEKLNDLIEGPYCNLTMQKIEEAYTLQHQSFKLLSTVLFPSIRIAEDISIFWIKRKSNLITADNIPKRYKDIQMIYPLSVPLKDDIEKDMQAFVDFVIGTFNSLDAFKFRLPNFETHWNIYLQEQKRGGYTKKMKQCLNSQLTKHFISNWKKSKKSEEIKVHLILEGSDLTNIYYGYYFQFFTKLAKGQKQNQYKQLKPYNIENALNRLKIGAITTSSYHSIFGFLLALGYEIAEIKQEMIRIRDIALTSERKDIIQSYFDSNQWLKISTQDYKQFWTYVRSQKLNFFQQFEKTANKSLKNTNISTEFQQIRNFYKHEQDKINKYCDQMMDEISAYLSKIDNQEQAKTKSLQIAKKFAFNYTCDIPLQINKRKSNEMHEHLQHQFQTSNRSSTYLYETVVKKMLQFYGSFLQGLVSNVLTAQVRVNLSKIDSATIYKGIMIKQLLTVFRMKNYVMKKLNQKMLKQNITLLQFFNNAPNKILLNFTTIHVEDARLQFMNKNTLPNIPVWAAIVSATSLPIFYRQFQCPKQWENPVFDKSSLFERIVNDFFKSQNCKREVVKYTSGNIISSLPMELLTNETTMSKMFVFEGKQNPQGIDEPYLHIGFAFNSDLQNYMSPTFKLKRSYIDIGYIQAGTIFWNKPSSSEYKQNCNDCRQTHKITKYKQKSILLKEYNLINKLLNLFGQGQSTKFISIMTESNDNFVLYSYWDKLVKLPIKIDTLQFSSIINKQMKEYYGVDVPSEKTKETIQQSEQITKYFSKNKLINYQNEESDIKNDTKDRFLINFRVQIVAKNSKIPGTKSLYGHIQFLSHSKWNRNKFNNFLIDYSIDPSHFVQTANRAENSQITWQLNQSHRIYLRFYFPYYKNDTSLVLYTQFSFDVTQIIDDMPLTDSFDYSFNFSNFLQGNELLDNFNKIYLGPTQWITAYKRNRYQIQQANNVQNAGAPRLLIRRWRPEKKEPTQYYVRALTPQSIVSQ